MKGKQVSPYLKMKVLSAIDFAEGRTIRERIKAVSEMTFTDEEGHPHQFTWRTISTWLYRFKVSGTTSMVPNPRSDKGVPRKTTPEEVLEAIEQVRPFFRGKSATKAAIYRACIEKGLLHRDQIAPNTFSRMVNTFELLKPDKDITNKKRLAFAKAFANQMWQADTMFGPYIKSHNTSVQTKLIAFIDDASRVVTHGEFFTRENTDTLNKAFRTALYKRGVPDQLYVDNGSIYSSKEMTLICTRLGILLSHTPVRDGAAKGKIERFFKTVREKFLIQQLDLSSLEQLNRAFITWLEKDYNNHPHSTLGMTPIDRFGLDMARIKFLSPDPVNDELFFLEEDRTVSNDNTFRVKNIYFEAPIDLRNKKIQIRYDRHNLSHAIVYYKDKRIGIATPLNRVANDRPPKGLKD